MRRVSNSELGTFRRCRRRWWLGYHRGLSPRRDDESSQASIGTLVHKSLRAYYGDGVNPLETLERELVAAVERAPEQAEDVAKVGALCRAMLEGYLQWLEETGEDEDLEIIDAEREVRVPLTSDVELLGKLDLRVRRKHDGARLFLDHKTVGNLTDLPKTARLDTQMLTYHLLEFLAFAEAHGRNPEENERSVGGVYNMLRKVKRTAAAKPPFYGRHEVRHNLHELRSHWQHVVAVASDIAQAEAALTAGTSPHVVAPPDPRGDCAWSCPFFAVCPMFDDGSDVESVLPALYDERDPYARYEELSKSTE